MTPELTQPHPLRPIRVLAVDDEAPSLADLVYELKTFAEVTEVVEAENADNALRALRSSSFDVVFLDVRMPGLDGLELGRVLNQFRTPPPIVFVTAFESHAVEAFDVDAVDYLLKPVRRERLAIALAKAAQRRLGQPQGGAAQPGPDAAVLASVIAPALVPALVSVLASVPDPTTAVELPTPPSSDAPVDSARDSARDSAPEADDKSQFDGEMISLEVGGRIRMIHRSDVMFVSASGDYVRLHVGESSVLVRVAMTTLEERWAAAGFVRIHRSYLVALTSMRFALNVGAGISFVSVSEFCP